MIGARATPGGFGLVMNWSEIKLGMVGMVGFGR
jgi:hypothetical protein